MKVICIINLKGGVAKSISAINIAHILATKHSKRVLLIDCDKQGNTSKFFGVHSYDKPSLANILTAKNSITTSDVIKGTKYDWLHVLPANMNLLHADREILLDVSRPQQTRLKKALQEFNHCYDYAVSGLLRG